MNKQSGPNRSSSNLTDVAHHYTPSDNHSIKATHSLGKNRSAVEGMQVTPVSQHQTKASSVHKQFSSKSVNPKPLKLGSSRKAVRQSSLRSNILSKRSPMEQDSVASRMTKELKSSKTYRSGLKKRRKSLSQKSDLSQVNRFMREIEQRELLPDVSQLGDPTSSSEETPKEDMMSHLNFDLKNSELKIGARKKKELHLQLKRQATSAQEAKTISLRKQEISDEEDVMIDNDSKPKEFLFTTPESTSTHRQSYVTTSSSSKYYIRHYAQSHPSSWVAQFYSQLRVTKGGKIIIEAIDSILGTSNNWKARFMENPLQGTICQAYIASKKTKQLFFALFLAAFFLSRILNSIVFAFSALSCLFYEVREQGEGLEGQPKEFTSSLGLKISWGQVLQTAVDGFCLLVSYLILRKLVKQLILKEALAKQGSLSFQVHRLLSGYQDFITSIVTLLAIPIGPNERGELTALICSDGLQAFNLFCIMDNQFHASVVALVQIARNLVKLELLDHFFDLAVMEVLFLTATLFFVIAGIRLAIVTRKAKYKISRQLCIMKEDYWRVFHTFPQGVMIYSLEDLESERSESSMESKPSEPSRKICVKFVNNELRKVLNPLGEGEDKIGFLLSQKCFRLAKDGGQLLSLKQILKENSVKDRIMYCQHESTLDVQPGSDDGSDQEGMREVKRVIHLEVVVREIQYEDSRSFLIILQNMNEVINNQNQKLQALYKEALTATISHEQLNPLNSIINFTKMTFSSLNNLCATHHDDLDTRSPLNSNYSDQDSDYDECFEVTKGDLKLQMWRLNLVHSSATMLRLLNTAMLNSSEIRTNKYTPNYSVVKDPFRIIKNFVSLFRVELYNKNLDFELNKNIFGDQPVVEAFTRQGILLDVKLYEQILYNVFTNACKFNSKNGFIKMSVSVFRAPHQAPPKTFSARGKLDKLILQTQIEDSGCGMTQKQLNRLFKVFETIKMNASPGFGEKNDALIKKSTSGFGLGLYLSLELVRFLKGDIKVESDLDQGKKGTKVTITFLVDVNQDESNCEDKLKHVSHIQSIQKQTSLSLEEEEEPKSGTKFKKMLSMQSQGLNRKISFFDSSNASDTNFKRDNSMRSKKPRKALTRVRTSDQLQSKVDEIRKSRIEMANERREIQNIVDNVEEFKDSEESSEESHDLSSNSSPDTHTRKAQIVKINIEEVGSEDLKLPRTQSKREERKLQRIVTFARPSSRAKGSTSELEKKSSDSSFQFSKAIQKQLNSNVVSEIEVSPNNGTAQHLAEKLDSTREEWKYNITTEENESHLFMPDRLRTYLENCPQILNLQEIGLHKAFGPYHEHLQFVQSQKGGSEGPAEKAVLSSESVLPSNQAQILHESSNLTSSLQTEMQSSVSDSGPLQNSDDSDRESQESHYISSTDDSFQNQELEAIQEVEEEEKNDESPDFLVRRNSGSLSQILEVEDEGTSGVTSIVTKALGQNQYLKQPTMNAELLQTPALPRQKSISKNNPRRHSMQTMMKDEMKFKVGGSSSNYSKKLSLVGTSNISPPRTKLTRSQEPTICKCRKSPILIVDDNAFNLETLKMMIKQRFSFEPDAAMNGQEAFEMFKARNSPDVVSECLEGCPRQHYHLVFMDLNMPVMDGFESTTKILEFQRSNPIPIQHSPYSSANFDKRRSEISFDQIEPSVFEESKLLGKADDDKLDDQYPHHLRCEVMALTAFVNQTNLDKCKDVGMVSVLNKPASNKEVGNAILTHCPFLQASYQVVNPNEQRGKNRRSEKNLLQLGPFN